jgi:ABC-type lipoprotein export system ATPase subunit
MSDDIEFEILSLKNISHIYDQENHKLKVLSNINIVLEKEKWSPL